MNKIDSKILYIHSMDSHCSYEKEVLDQCALNNIHNELRKKICDTLTKFYTFILWTPIVVMKKKC